MTIEEDIKTTLKKLALVLREQTAAAEKSGKIDSESMQSIIDSGFFKALQPSVFGGYELDFTEYSEMVSIIGKGCTSAGWIAGTVGMQSWFLGLMTKQAQQDVWGDDPNALLTSSWAPDGTAKITPGGYQLAGHWQFCSGSDFASWSVFGAAILSENNQTVNRGYFLVPNSDYEIIGGWEVSALVATGSHDAKVSGSFVPEHRFVSVTDLVNGVGPGSRLHSAPIYRMPLLACSPLAVIAPLIGAAEGMLEYYIDQMKSRTTSGNDSSISEEPIVQEHVARAAANVDAARLIITRDTKEAMATVAEGEILTIDQRLQFRRGHGFAARLLSEAADILFAASGGKGLYLDNHLQRAFRDIKGGVNHITSSWDIAGPLWGANAFGLKPKIPMY